MAADGGASGSGANFHVNTLHGRVLANIVQAAAGVRRATTTASSKVSSAL